MSEFMFNSVPQNTTKQLADKYQFDARVPKPSAEQTKEADAREQLERAFLSNAKPEPLSNKINKFVGNSKLEWKYVGDEQFREYHFPDGDIAVDQPLYLHVNENNNHRIITRLGTSVYVPFKWLAISWQVREGLPFFAF